MKTENRQNEKFRFSEEMESFLKVKREYCLVVKRIKGLRLPTRKKEYRLTYMDGSQEAILNEETLIARICGEYIGKRNDLSKIERQIFGLRYDSTMTPHFYRVIKEEWSDVTDDAKKRYRPLCIER